MSAKNVISKDFVAVDADETISRLIGKMFKAKKNNVIITRDRKALGVLDRRRLLDSSLSINEEKVAKMLKRVSAVNVKDDEKAIARKMAFSDSHMLPVTDRENMPIGAVYAIDLAELLPEEQMRRKLAAFEKKKMILFAEDDPVRKAIKVMKEGKIEHLPIVDKTGKLSAVLSAVDLLRKFSRFPRKRAGGKRFAKLPRDCMGKDEKLVNLPVLDFANFQPVFAHRNDTVGKAVSLMRENHVSDVMIVNDFGEPAGIITLKDLADLAALYL